MKLFITRDVSPSDVCFLIRDELGRDKYTAVMKRRKRSMRGVVNNIVRLNILDAGVNSFTLKTDKTAATLVVLMTNNMVQCRFYGNNWRILGDVISKNFSIVDVDNAQICNHIKHPLGCELEIADAQNELICLMTALCVNMINTVDKREVQVV